MAAQRRLRRLLDLPLVFVVAAPRHAEEAGLALDPFAELRERGDRRRARVAERGRAREQLRLHRLEDLADQHLGRLERHRELVAAAALAGERGALRDVA